MKKVKEVSLRAGLFIGIVGMIVYFPLWWYGQGFFRFARRIFYFWRERAYGLGILIWLKNIFVPMYGQGDFVGRLISFVIRLVQIIIRSLILLFWLIICLILIIFWLICPLLIIWASILHLSV